MKLKITCPQCHSLVEHKKTTIKGVYFCPECVIYFPDKIRSKEWAKGSVFKLTEELAYKLPKHDLFNGEKCSGCDHAVSNHEVVNTNNKGKLSIQLRLRSCLICKGENCHW